jgi:hypothetical protein
MAIISAPAEMGTADEHVLWTAGDGHRAPHVGRERDGEQERQRAESERLQRRNDQWREDEADGVVAMRLDG